MRFEIEDLMSRMPANSIRKSLQLVPSRPTSAILDDILRFLGILTICQRAAFQQLLEFALGILGGPKFLPQQLKNFHATVIHMECSIFFDSQRLSMCPPWDSSVSLPNPHNPLRTRFSCELGNFILVEGGRFYFLQAHRLS
jgi:hypothetical protein